MKSGSAGPGKTLRLTQMRQPGNSSSKSESDAGKEWFKKVGVFRSIWSQVGNISNLLPIAILLKLNPSMVFIFKKVEVFRSIWSQAFDILHGLLIRISLHAYFYTACPSHLVSAFLGISGSLPATTSELLLSVIQRC
jgi:hypothetical protein